MGMSHPNDERIELLITRKLDGTITDDERLELDRALIRSPEHRHMLERSELIDALCAEALRSEFRRPREGDVSSIIAKAGRARRPSRYWWCLPAALAACLGLILVSGWFADGGRERRSLVEQAPFPSTRTPPVVPAFESRPSHLANGTVRPEHIRRVSTGTDVMDRRRDTSVYGIVGEDGRIYLIEFERTRTYRYPFGNAGIRVARKGL